MITQAVGTGQGISQVKGNLNHAIARAWAVGEQDCVGSLEVGKHADILVLDAPSHTHLCYHFGVNLVETVIKNGKVIVENGQRLQ